MPDERAGFAPEPEDLGLLPADAGEVPWPPWLENLSDGERIAAIVSAVASCCSAPAGPGHDDGRQHCTPVMAEHFLRKMLPAQPAAPLALPPGEFNLVKRIYSLLEAGSVPPDGLRPALFAILEDVPASPGSVTVSREDLAMVLRATSYPNYSAAEPAWERLLVAAGVWPAHTESHQEAARGESAPRKTPDGSGSADVRSQGCGCDGCREDS